MSQQQEDNIMDRKRWNAFKYAYHKAHPMSIRDSKYYAHVRKAYKQQGVPTLSTWLIQKPSKVLQKNKNG